MVTGVGHVRRVESGRWEARYRAPDGRERARRFATRREAQAYLAQFEVDRRDDNWVDPKAGRLLLRDWAPGVIEGDVRLRPSSKARDEAYLRTHVLPRFGDSPLRGISPMEVRAWIRDLHQSGLSAATVQKIHQTLAKVMRAAVEARLIRRNPTDGVPLPRIERQEMRVITPSEIARLADTITPHYRAMVIVGAYGGLRLGELAGLRRSQIDLARQSVRISEIAVEVRGQVHYGPPKTNAGRRTVPLPRLATDALGAHLDRYTHDDPAALVFAGVDGGVLRASQWRQRHWRPAIRAAEVEPLRPHDLRHTAVSLWIAAGANPRQVATWAGHTSVSVVLDRYGHLFPGHERDVINRLDALGSRDIDLA